MKTNVKFIFPALMLALFVIGCKKDKNNLKDPEPPKNEAEVITTLKLTFTDTSANNETFSFYFRDSDGPGGNSPSQWDTIRLKQNVNYLVKIEFLNEGVSPVVNYNTEITEEGNEHLVCYIPSNGLNLIVTRTDSDGTYELGLLSDWKTNGASNGNTVIKLKHQPGVKNGSCDVGETDVEVSFVTVIE